MAAPRYSSIMSTPDKNGQISVDVSSFDDEQRTPPPQQYHQSSGSTKASWRLQDWTPTALLVSYFVFSIALYTTFDHYTNKVFWFLYLTIATLVAGVTALEAYDGLTPLKEARKALKKASETDFKWKTSDVDLPTLHLIFDLADGNFSDGIANAIAGVMYPPDKLAVTFLRSGSYAQTQPMVDYIGRDQPSSARVFTLPGTVAASLSARVAYCMSLDVPKVDATVTGVFQGHERLHPHAARHAVERLLQDAKIDIVQGRSILVPQTSQSKPLSILSSLHHDMVNALLQPGRALTWGLKLPNETNAFWRTESLRAAASAGATASEDGLDLGYASLQNLSRTAFDLKVIAFAPGPNTFAEYRAIATRTARQYALATVRYSKLAFSRYKTSEGKGSKPTLKGRVAILYALPILRIVSHAVLQYFCMSLAMLFVHTPHSASDLARAIYFPYSVSEWFIIIGLIALVATVGMLYKARSEFVPGWTAPLFLLAYPFLLVFQAGVDVYGQLDAIIK